MIRDMDKLIKKSEELLPSEELFMEAVREMMKDQIKNYLKQKMNENPKIRDAIREAMLDYVAAKVKESEAIAKLVKAYAQLGIMTLPSDMKSEIISTLYSTFKDEIDEVIEKTI